jgi:aspartate kinase
MKLVEKLKREVGATGVRTDENIAKVSIVGLGMRSHAGVAAKMFRTLADVNINIQMIATSEIKTSIVVDAKFVELAVRVLHDVFVDAEEPPA